MSLQSRRKKCNRLGERYYPMEGRREFVLRAAIGKRLTPRSVYVDAGAGAYMGLARLFAPQSALSIGLDVEPMHAYVMVKGSRGVQGDLAALPLRDESVDIISMRSVLEHLEDPDAVFRGMNRVLRPGGWVVAMAPSKWYYASVIGRLVPDSLAAPLLQFIFGQTVYDNFPTYYRANSPRALSRIASRTGFDLVEASVCPHPPDYLKFSPVLFRVGVMFDRMVGWLPWTRMLQASHLYVLRKT